VSRAVVIGLARSGTGAANLLLRQGEKVTVTDIRREEDLRERIKDLSPGVDLALGGHPEALLDEADLIVVSPGVPLSIEPLRRARERGVEIIGELELAWRVLCGIPFYAVTGTNGKSTTVSLLEKMLEAAGRRSLLAGNIGNALSTEILARSNGEPGLPGVDCVVVEVSSFQLEAIRMFRPRLAAVLNVTPDHLDRYRSLGDYRLAKERIALNQEAGDVLVLNADDPECLEIAASPLARKTGVRFFSRMAAVPGIHAEGGVVFTNRGAPEELIAQKEMALQGEHNLENAMAASLMALLAGCPREAVRRALREFPGLEHRLEFVREVRGVRYVNDSKGTNVGAVMKSLEGFAAPVVLIAGGRDKGGDFAPLVPLVGAHCRALVLMGEAREKMAAALSGAVPCTMAADMRDAVLKAARAAMPGDMVLLSPACASFDMFQDFEDRGRRFKEAVGEL
jgi:UDP-N-acetylmuramoylalanine--D-glutamate ligase